MSWCNDLHEICRAQVPLAPLTWFGLGGPARWLVEPRSESELSTVLHRSAESGVPVRFLGLGANLLVPDEGVDAAVIRLNGPVFRRIIPADSSIEAGAGAHLTTLVRTAVHGGLAGLEALAGIPGTVGGGIRMNCGGRHGEIASAVESVRVISSQGRLRDCPADALRFRYRACELGGERVVSARFHLERADRGLVLERFREIWREKSRSQPALREKSAGCIFKNPPGGASAGRLIDESGLKGARMGGAEVSDRHANFIVAHTGARTADVLALVERIEERVFIRTGVRLEREVEVW